MIGLKYKKFLYHCQMLLLGHNLGPTLQLGCFKSINENSTIINMIRTKI